MARTRRERNRKRPEVLPPPPRLISRDEKRELILAHAATRKPLKPRDRMVVWGGVAICALFILGAWATTVQSGIDRLWASASNDELAEIIDAGRDLSSEISDATAKGKTGLQAEFDRIEEDVQHASELDEARSALRVRLMAETDGSASSTPGTGTATGTTAE